MINVDHQQPIEINPTTAAKYCVIWLHGLGADGSDFVPIVPELKLPKDLPVRFIFPHAPVMPVTVNQGYKMPAWFDIYGVSIADKIDEAGIMQSSKLLHTLVAQENKRGISTNRIILAGFSQGAVIALTAGLTYPERLGGILALSGYLPLADQLLQKDSPANRDCPIFIGHGTEDGIVPYALGKATFSALNTAGYPVTWRSYPMTHSVCAEEVGDISQWMQKSLLG